VSRARTATLSRKSTFFVSYTKPAVPAEGGPFVPRILPFSEQKRQFERLPDADKLELAGGQERFGGIAAIEGSAEAHLGRAVRGHEQLFV
jgi:hypothetical protein